MEPAIRRGGNERGGRSKLRSAANRKGGGPIFGRLCGNNSNQVSAVCEPWTEWSAKRARDRRSELSGLYAAISSHEKLYQTRLNLFYPEFSS
jgi:hypothetical protein